MGESPNMVKVKAMKQRRRFAGESRGRCLLTNPTVGWGATLWAVSNEHRASLVKPISRCRASRCLANGSTGSGNLTETAVGPGGVLVAARREGLCRNWRSPPDPREKDPGER